MKNDHAYLILFMSTENDTFVLSDRATFDKERPWLDRSTTKHAASMTASHGFDHYTDFLKAGFDFFRVCHDAPECPIK